MTTKTKAKSAQAPRPTTAAGLVLALEAQLRELKPGEVPPLVELRGEDWTQLVQLARAEVGHG